MATLALPKEVARRSLTTLREKLVKTAVAAGPGGEQSALPPPIASELPASAQMATLMLGNVLGAVDMHERFDRHKKLLSALMALAALVSVAGPAGANDAVHNGIDYLREVMDQYHDRIPVYDDVSSPGNRFHAPAVIPAGAAVSMNGSYTGNPHSGATAIRFKFEDVDGANAGGFYLLNGVLPPGATAPLLNFGTVPNAGVNLSGARKLRFWVRGEEGGEKIEFFMGGVGWKAETGMPEQPYPGSTMRHPPLGTLFTLSTEWQRISIDVRSLDLSYVLGGFGWFADATNNPGGAVFYVDDIEYVLGSNRLAQRLDEARFLRSFTTEPFQNQPAPVNDFDLVLRNVAFTYDNALALLAFLAEGSADSLRRARIIGNAFVYAAAHDRSFDDGRLRTAYAAGDIKLPPGWTPNGRVATVPVSGYWDEFGQKFFEVEQGSVDVGNNAWAMIALLALHRRTGDKAYLNAAKKIAVFIRGFRNDSGTFKGFKGGIDDAETATPALRPWASTEHSLDVFAAFSALHAISGQAWWLGHAEHARKFVTAMIDSQTGCLLAGTIKPEMRNSIDGQLPLDTQSWGVLAQPAETAQHAALLACAERKHKLQSDGFRGFDFNEDKDGVWFEGTAQMAAAYGLVGEQDKAAIYLEELRRAQATPPFGDGQGLVAASQDGISTGFEDRFGNEIKLFRRLHVAAVAWHIFAQLQFNPFHTDLDGDGLPDNFEQLNPGLDYLNPDDAALDNDGDDLNNLDEFQRGTGVNDADSDEDGTKDGEEVDLGRDPLLSEPAVMSIIHNYLLDL